MGDSFGYRASFDRAGCIPVARSLARLIIGEVGLARRLGVGLAGGLRTGAEEAGQATACPASEVGSDEQYMLEAVAQAAAAQAAGEVPVGAVVLIEGEIKGRGHNLVISNSDPTAHAEIVAIRDAARTVGNYRLTGATMYTTIEPCAMCAGAIVHARIGRLVFGARDPRAGAVVTHFGVCTTEFLNHQVIVEEGILESECRSMIQSFFRDKRELE